MYSPCDLCGAIAPDHVLDSPRLDGPLVRCRSCGLLYVGRRRSDFTFSSADPARSAELAERVTELDLVRHEVEDAERPWRVEADRDRLTRLRRHLSAGRVLDVGSANGTFLEVAAAGGFEVEGVEPDPGTSAASRAAGLAVTSGTLDDLPPGSGFDAITMFHVIEHLDSPRRALLRAHELLRPGGVVVVETPTVDCLWWRIAPARSHWRQLIPDHYYLFARATLTELLCRCGFEPVEHEKVARRVSLRFAADRARRSGVPGAAALGPVLGRLGLERRSVRINPGDIMSVVARRPR
jgi:2-polyprenyl-3-methyl-5-hydroxy-6-metoxy-1,4-benzoquinol methylase